MNNMQFLDLKAQYKDIKKEIDIAIGRVLENSCFVGGQEVAEFEKEITRFCRTKYAVAVNSGTDALFLSLKAIGVESGDEVITSPFTFIATAEVIANLGAKPVFADIDPQTFNIDPLEVEKRITKKTKAIVPVHLYGQMADMSAIMKIAKKHKLKVIEDAAQAIGSTEFERNAGTLGDSGCFSFFPSKNLSAYGDGGMLVTNNKNLADKVRLLRNHGSSPKDKYKNLLLGINSRLDAIQAAILRVKLKHLQKWNKERAKKASYYNYGLNRVSQIITPYIAPGHTHVYHQYTIRVNKKIREKLIDYLKNQKIPAMIYYPLPLHLQPVFKCLGYKKGDFPETEKAAQEVLSLPIYPELLLKDQDLVIQKLKNYFLKKK